jgi:2-keto-4-pentenoate hydratase/2-oxohepta-3-ene-1,7-dioic acid hydratase in catechol pathway
VPAYYKGMPDTVVGPDTEVSWPAYSDELDHELELAAVIGCTVKDVAPEDALAGIFGYTIWNDFSARDTQRREIPVGMGPAKAKDWDGSNALRPCIVTPGEFDATNAVRRCATTVSSGARTRPPTCTTPLPTWSPTRRAARPRARARSSGRERPPAARASGSAGGSRGDVVELEVDGIGVLCNHIGRKGA